MRRVGIIGIENSHTLHFLRHLNTERRFADAACTAVLRGTPERVGELTEITPLDVLDRPEDFVGAVDAAIICSRDGALHRSQAEPLLRAGIPVLIDKPLATTTVDAQALVDLAASSGSTLMSASAVRFAPEVAQLKSAIPSLGGLAAVSVTGPADPDSPYSGIFFYGIHIVETAFELIGLPAAEFDPDSLSVLTRGAVTVATASVAGVAVTLRFVTPDDQGQNPFQAAVFGRRGNATENLTLGPDYNFPLLERFMMAIDGRQPDGPADLVAPIRLTEQIRAAVRPEPVPAQEIR
jgi:predicted dehydrogenase